MSNNNFAYKMVPVWQAQPTTADESSNVIPFPGYIPAPDLDARVDELLKGDSETTVRTNSPFKSNGVPKAKPADPIRNAQDVRNIITYFRDVKKSPRKALLFLMGFTLGIRGGDLLNLKVRDVRTRDGRILDRLEIYEDKTNKFNRLPLTPQVREMLGEILTVMDDQEDPLFPSRQRDKYGFLKPYTIQQLTNLIKEAARECNVPGHISSHSMRKTCVYHMLKNNTRGREGELTIQYMLNHDSFSTTLRYCGLQDELLEAMKVDLANEFAI